VRHAVKNDERVNLSIEQRQTTEAVWRSEVWNISEF